MKCPLLNLLNLALTYSSMRSSHSLPSSELCLLDFFKTFISLWTPSVAPPQIFYRHLTLWGSNFLLSLPISYQRKSIDFNGIAPDLLQENHTERISLIVSKVIFSIPKVTILWLFSAEINLFPLAPPHNTALLLQDLTDRKILSMTQSPFNI